MEQILILMILIFLEHAVAEGEQLLALQRRHVARVGARASSAVSAAAMISTLCLPAPLSTPAGPCPRRRGLGRLLFPFRQEAPRRRRNQSGALFPRTRRRGAPPARPCALQAVACNLLERSLFWWSRPERLRKLIRVEGEEKSGHSSTQENRHHAGAAFRRPRCRRSGAGHAL